MSLVVDDRAVAPDLPPDLATATAAKVETPFRRFVSDYCDSRVALAALVLLATLIVLAIIAPWIVPQNPYDLGQVDVMDSRLVPGTKSSNGKYTHWLGTDGAGRDL